MDNEQDNIKATQPRNTWFFERGDGFIFATDEIEAWSILHNRGNWMRRDFKMLGMSDGKTYYEILKNSKKEISILQNERAVLDVDLQKYLKTEERLRFSELRDDDDEMVIKVKSKIDELNLKIGEIDNKLKDFSKTLVDKAFNAELEKARGNMVQPSNQDILTPNPNDRAGVLNNLKI